MSAAIEEGQDQENAGGRFSSRKLANIVMDAAVPTHDKDTRMHAQRVVDDIFPPQLVGKMRRAEVVSPLREIVKLGNISTFDVNLEEKDPSKRVSITLPTETIGGSATSYNLDWDTEIPLSNSEANLKLSPHKDDFRSSTSSTEITVKKRGLSTRTVHTPTLDKHIDALTAMHADNMPDGIAVGSEAPGSKARWYDLKHSAVTNITEQVFEGEGDDKKVTEVVKGVKIVLPAVDHLKSYGFTTLEATPEGVTKVVDIVPKDLIQEVDGTKDDVKDAKVVLGHLQDYNPNITPDIVTALELRHEVIDEANSEFMSTYQSGIGYDGLEVIYDALSIEGEETLTQFSRRKSARDLEEEGKKVLLPHYKK
jgi:hypothetical protein